jgi:uncharacterized membrane protein YfcA
MSRARPPQRDAAALSTGHRQGPGPGTAGSSSRFAAIGFSGGFLGSLLGVGGGFVMVPLQVLWTRVAQHTANGTSLAAIAPLTLAGMAVYALAGGDVDWRLVLPLAAGAVLGAFVGARWASHLPERQLRRVVAAVILIAGVKQLLFPG